VTGVFDAATHNLTCRCTTAMWQAAARTSAPSRVIARMRRTSPRRRTSRGGAGRLRVPPGLRWAAKRPRHRERLGGHFQDCAARLRRGLPALRGEAGRPPGAALRGRGRRRCRAAARLRDGAPPGHRAAAPPRRDGQGVGPRAEGEQARARWAAAAQARAEAAAVQSAMAPAVPAVPVIVPALRPATAPVAYPGSRRARSLRKPAGRRAPDARDGLVGRPTSGVHGDHGAEAEADQRPGFAARSVRPGTGGARATDRLMPLPAVAVSGPAAAGERDPRWAVPYRGTRVDREGPEDRGMRHQRTSGSDSCRQASRTRPWSSRGPRQRPGAAAP
jgi:hypothetical protein